LRVIEDVERLEAQRGPSRDFLDFALAPEKKETMHPISKSRRLETCRTPLAVRSRRPLKAVLQFCLGSSLLLASAPATAQTKPQRIVSTAPSITETLFALGIGDRVVGVSQFCNYPSEVQKLPKVGSYIKPDAEAIARLAPDLVILERNSSELTERLNTLHIAFVEVPHSTLEDIYAEIQIIGKAAEVQDRAANLVGQIKGSLDAIQSKAKAMASPRAIVIVDRQQGTLNNLTAVGPGNYVNQILEIAGGTNVLAKPGLPQYPHISLETVLRENPDVIIDLSSTQETEAARKTSRAETLALWKQHHELTAVRNGHVYAGTNDSLVVPGSRTPIATQRLFDFVHGIGGSD
jgi:iron complex transport system substrate-binding protein